MACKLIKFYNCYVWSMAGLQPGHTSRLSRSVPVCDTLVSSNPEHSWDDDDDAIWIILSQHCK